MASEVTELLVTLKEWQKAIQQLRHQGKTAEDRQQQLEQASKKVLQCLSDDTVEAKIEALIQEASQFCEQSAQAGHDLLKKAPETLITVELSSLHPLNVSRTQFQRGAIAPLPAPSDEPCLEDLEQVQRIFVLLSSALAQEHQATTTLSRKPKKRRRRNITLGALQTLLGIGLLAGNTQLEMRFANASYILGGNALLSALQNLVGENPKPG
ncbi:MAG: hypothetical protein AAGD09_04905 [Cyanobacteria bacterium P01_F01_bin.56]